MASKAEGKPRRRDLGQEAQERGFAIIMNHGKPAPDADPTLLETWENENKVRTQR